MKLKKLNKSKGFTIIETLIVLAIAATIFLVVFLAVTALNRSSRNTQRKDDAAAVIAGMSEYAGNNSGVLPTVDNFAAPPNLKLCAASDANCANANNTDVPTTVKIGYYSGTSNTPDVTGDIYIGASTAGITAASAKDSLNVIIGDTCTGNLPTPGSSRGVAAVYGIESSSGFNWVCEAS